MRVGIVVSRFHPEVTSRLLAGAREAFRAMGGADDHLAVLEAPGCFELPVVVAALLDRGAFDAVIALGCIITGETRHDEYIAHATAHALANLALESRTPVCLGVLTCATIEQAHARAGGEKGNKGAEAMRAAIDAAHAIAEARRLTPRERRR